MRLIGAGVSNQRATALKAWRALQTPADTSVAEIVVVVLVVVLRIIACVLVTQIWARVRLVSLFLSYLCHCVFWLGLGVLITCISVWYSVSAVS